MSRLKLVFLLLALGRLSAQGLEPLLQPSVNPQPGAYQAPVSITVTAPEGAAVRYRFLETPSTQTFPWQGPILLDALSGETRTVTLRLTTDLPTGETLTRDYRYQIVRAVEQQPTVQPVPGVFMAPVTVHTELPEGWTLSLDGQPAAVSLLDAPVGTRQTFVLEAHGPRGQILTWVYTIDRRDQEALALELLSPVAGAWDNPQPLIASFQGTDRVLWSYGSHLDQASARAYEGPVVLDRTGVQSVTLAGRSRLDGTWTERTVTWTNGTSAPPAGWPASGVRLQGLELPAVPGATLSWDEGRSWQPATAQRGEASSLVNRKVLTVQLKRGSTARYVWWLDSRSPTTPTLQFVGGWNPQLVFSGGVEALHSVSWTAADGKTIDEPQALWGPVGVWKVPDGVVGARVSVVGANGVPGVPAALGFAATGWSTPEWEPWDNRGPQSGSTRLPLGGRVVPRAGFRAAYEISDRPDVAEPGSGSPWLEGALLPTVPWGADRTFYVRFAWRDESGLTGPASPVVIARVDRVPPLAPEVQEVASQVMVRPAEGEEEGTSLLWSVTTDRVASPSSLTFQPYTSPMGSEALRDGAGGKLWFHAQAQDWAGNLGPARLNVALAPASDSPVLVQVDPDPSVGESSVEDGGVYPWPQFRLRALDQGKDLWVGVYDLAGVPADWKNRVQPWTGVFSRGVGRGERRTFLIYWNARSADGWVWPQPKTLTLTLDQGPPAAPVADAWPSGPLATAWTLALRPGRQGDVLRYSSTTDGSPPSDPIVSGELWPGTRTWDAPPSGRVVVRLRVTAVSVSGLAVEMPGTPPVSIDRSTPPAVAPGLEPFNYRTGPLLVAAPAAPGTVRFSLTIGGGEPEVPTAASPAVPRAGMSLEGTAGQSVLYRFRWRPFSAAGLAGAATDTFAVLVDRTGATQDAGPSSAGPAFVPRLSGLPASGASALPVTVSADGPSDLLRYEITEGVGLPRAVTVLSPRWQPLVLDPGVGTDRSYVIGVRAFNADGRPLSEEIRYPVRVDRSVPAAPQFQLLADPRRPEAVLSLTADGRSPEELLSYRWSWESFPQGKGEIAWTTLSGQPPRFIAPSGALTRLRAQAFFRDEAGNEGPTTEQTLLVDQNVVYLAPRASGDGTRGNPAGGLAEALDLARRTGRSVIFSAAGNYLVPRTLDLDGLQVYGGLAPDLWDATVAPGRSVWTAAPSFSGVSLLESGNRDWSMERVDLSTGDASIDRVVVVRGANATLKSSAWNWAKAGGGWDQIGGRVELTDITATYAAEPGTNFLELSSLTAAVKGLNLSAIQNQGGLLFSLKDTQSLFQDLAVVSKKSSGFEGVWFSQGGRLTVNGARILAGDGASRATAFVLKDSDAVFFNLELSLYGSDANTGFQATRGRLELQKSSISLLRGTEFNQGFVIDHGATILRTFQLKVETGSYQGGFSVDGGSLTLGSGKVQLAGGGQRAWGAQFLDSSLVSLDDVSWVLTNKTPSDLYKMDKPWKQGSAVTSSTSTGFN